MRQPQNDESRNPRLDRSTRTDSEDQPFSESRASESGISEDSLRQRLSLPSALGAITLPFGTFFRVWAPAAEDLMLQVETDDGPIRYPLVKGQARDQEGGEEDGYFTGLFPEVTPGTRYRYLIDGKQAFPDPCSRSQPEGVHGPSEVIDPTAFGWTDASWPGITMSGLVIYELHVGAFTEEGAFEAIIPHLARLRELGITAIELMPIAEFPGQRGWGYDGVDLYAPFSQYGGPEGLRRLVDAAHSFELGVILDLVYNHLGPDGNYLRAYSLDYFTSRYQTPWGEALNFDGEYSHGTRRFVLGNVWHWIEEHHIDGIRLDATHAIYDSSQPHILQEIAETARKAAGNRSVVIIGENELNASKIITPTTRGGLGLDGVWSDDFHHAIHTALTGESDSYYEDYSLSTADIARAIREGFIFQGQVSKHSGSPRGDSIGDEPARSFVFCLQNHDQVGNRALGDRLHHLIGLDAFRAVAPLLLLAPETPLIFMGDEFGSSSPFQYFTDHELELGKLVTNGRFSEFKHFAAFRDREGPEKAPDPQAESTFKRSILDHSERLEEAGGGVYSLYRALLGLRRQDAVISSVERSEITGSGVGVYLWLNFAPGDMAEERLMLANLGDHPWQPEPSLLGDRHWRVILWTGAPEFGGAVEVANHSGLREGQSVDPSSLTVPPRSTLLLG